MKTGRNMIQQEDKAHTMHYFPPDQENDELNISYRSTLWNMVEHELRTTTGNQIGPSIL